MNEKHEKLLKFFSENKIELPIDVANSIDDVFNENENVADAVIYFREDLEELETDLIIVNEVDAYLDGPSSGSIRNTFTYYGDIKYSVSEYVLLYGANEQVLENITNINNEDMPSEVNPNSYAVVLIETVEWGEGKMTKKPVLYIYCPEKAGE